MEGAPWAVDGVHIPLEGLNGGWWSEGLWARERLLLRKDGTCGEARGREI